ncbi:ceramide kinase isoform X1 [Nothobranchius furzeri]|uniref:Ceramide kinase n=2 Tax=Nothobranchius furzeri TaxID=105023 RepID=A0A1A8AT96_NOTFU
MEEQPSLISSKLFLKNRQVEVALSRAVLTWKEIKESKNRIPLIPQADLSHAVPVSEIVAVHKPEDEDQPQMRRTQKKNKESSQFVPYAFTVSYVRRMKQHQWQCSDVTFLCDSRGLCEQWIQVTNEQLSLLTNRPKSLLVYINPCGGKQRGKRIYEQKVAPVFRQAGIFTDVIVTERANHARDHLRTEANLDKYDGVVCVGGDGMFSEILHGLVIRTQRDHDVDQNRPDAELVSCLSRIGIIPAGSTDCICFATVGTNDPVTSALHIIVGDNQPMDVCSVHHKDSFLRYSVSLLGYGFYGDLLADSEKKRWLGPARYDLSGFKTFFCHNFYEGTVCFLPAEDSVGHPRDKLQCKSGCRICQHKLESKEKHKEMPEEKEKAGKDSNKGWNVVRGEFISVNSACMSCSCPRCPKGLSPSAHLADGTTDLILIKKCSRMNFFRHLFRHTNKQDQFDHSFVEVHRVKKFHFQPKVDSPEDQSYHPERTACGPKFSNPKISNYSTAVSSWTCDGEILHHAAIQVSVQHQLIRLFARGIEEQQ